METKEPFKNNDKKPSRPKGNQPNRKKKKAPKTFSDRKKIKIITILFGVFFLFLVVRIFQVQIVLGSGFKDESALLRQDKVTVKSKRGTITDVNGEEFAVDTPIYSLWVDANYLRSKLKDGQTKEAVAQEVGTILNMDPNRVLQKIEQNAGFVWVKKNVNMEEQNAIRELPYAGFQFQDETTRYYPKKTIAGNLIGFANSDGVGGAGVEATYDDILNGEDGIIIGEKDGKNQFLQDSITEIQEPVDGNSIKLSLDQRAQYIAEREINNIKTTLQPKSAVIMVTRTKTGEILAVADTNSYDPNKFSEVEDEKMYQVMAFQATYEPGSTMKPVMVASALNEGAVTLSNSYYCAGAIQVDKYLMRCWIYPNAHGAESLTDVIRNSCNPGIINVAFQLRQQNPDAWYSYLDKFNFGKVTELGFAGEEIGIMPANNASVFHASTAMGQGISATAIQMTSAISALGNDGQLMAPILLKEVTDSQGNVVETHDPKIVNQVVTPETADTVLEMMHQVVENGTGTSGKLDTVPAAAKTGTSQKTDGGTDYVKGRYILSYIGMAPYPDPEYTVSVIIDEPITGGESSSTVGPYFKAVMEDVLKLYNVVEDENAAAEQGAALTTVPSLRGLTLEEGIRELEKAGLQCTSEGEGFIDSQSEVAFASIEKGQVVHVVLAGKEMTENQLVVPDFTGLRLPDIITRKGSLDLKLTYQGSGRVVSQSIEPGTVVDKGSTLNLSMEE